MQENWVVANHRLVANRKRISILSSARSQLRRLRGVTVAIVAVLHLAAGTAVKIGDAQALRGRGSISGIVLSSDGGDTPVESAVVSLRSHDVASDEITTLTDEAGRFEFQRLQHGRYLVTVAKAGFIRSSFGDGGSPIPGTPISIRGNLEDYSCIVRISRGGVIDGRVMDERFRSLEGVSVQLGVVRLAGPDESTSWVANQQTDRMGRYRFFGLPPGEYVAVAVPKEAPFQLTPGSGFGKTVTFYPGVRESALASRVELSSGKEAAGVDIRVATAVAGRLVGKVIANGFAPVDFRSIQVHIVDESSSFPLSVRNLLVDSGGAFRLDNVANGAYHLAATGVESRTGLRYWGDTSIDLPSGTLLQSDLYLERGQDLTGTIVSDDLQAPVPFDRLSVVLTSSRPHLAAIRRFSTVVEPAGRFTLPGVPKGTYRIAINDAGRPGEPLWTMVKSTAGGLDTLEQVNVPLAQSETIRLVASRLDSSIVGSILSDLPLDPADYAVVALLSPSSPGMLRRRVPRVVRPDSEGVFEIGGLLAGSYAIGTVPTKRLSRGMTPDLVIELDRSADQVVVSRGQRLVHRLRVPARR